MVEYGDSNGQLLSAPPGMRKTSTEREVKASEMPDAGFLDQDDLLRNFAADEAVANRALYMVRDIVQRHHNGMLPFYERWAISYWHLAGNTLDQKGPTRVHIPQVANAIETGKPRVIESLTAQRPYFRLRGRRQIKEVLAETMAAHIDFQLDQAGMEDSLQQAVDDLYVTGSFAWHVGWKDERIQVPLRKRTPEGKVSIGGYRTEKRYVGPTLDLIDPFDFIISTRAKDPQSADWVGHRGRYTMPQLRAMPHLDQGMLTVLEEKSSKTGNGSWLNTDEFKKVRSPAERMTYLDRFVTPKGAPPFYDVVTLYMPFSLKDDGNFEECQFVIGAGIVPLCVRRNPYDYKQRPYAAARSSAQNHVWHGVGPIDNAMRLGEQLDRTWAILMRTAEGAGCPMVFTDSHDAELPESLFHTRPFKVVKGAGKVTIQTVPGEALNAGPLMVGLLERKIEETIGVFRVQMGEESGAPTYGQAAIAQQEGNRRMSSLAVATGKAMNQAISHFIKLNAQFLSETDAFPNLGKRSKVLGKEYLTIGPDSYLEEVDVEILGLEKLRTYGLEAVGLQQIMATSTPFLVQLAAQGKADLSQLVYEQINALLGRDIADKIVTLRTNRADKWSQQEENLELLQGNEVEVEPDDPHELHRKILAPLVQKAKAGKLDQKQARVVLEHDLLHEMFMARQAEEDAMQAKENPQPMTPNPIAPEAGGIPPTNGGQGSSPQAGGFSAALTPQAAPGPRQVGAYGMAGRPNSPLSQQENMASRA